MGLGLAGNQALDQRLTEHDDDQCNAGQLAASGEIILAGGSGGLGSETARLLAGEGARLMTANVGGKFVAEERGAFDAAEATILQCRAEREPEAAMAPLYEIAAAHDGQLLMFYRWYGGLD